MKKLFLIPFLIVLAGILIFGGCAQQAPATTPAPTSAPPPTPVSAKVFELKFAAFNPPGTPIANANQHWVDMVEKQSGGRIKITCFFGESLVKQTEMFRAVQSGFADIGQYTVGTDPTIQPLNMVTRLPFIFLGLPNWHDVTAIHWALWNKFPELAKEFQGLKVVSIAAMAPDQFSFTKKEVRGPADMKGMKVIARGEWPKVMRAVGAAPLELPVGDWYMSLDRGLAEGQILQLAAAQSFKILELLKYHTMFGEIGCSTTLQAIMISSDTWNSLPPDLQKIMTDTGHWEDEEIGKEAEGALARAVKWAKDQNHAFTYLTPVELQSWLDTAKPVYEMWIADNAAKGPSKALYEETQRLVAQYSKK